MRRARESEESGAALIMAVIVMTVLTTLSVAVLARTLSVLNFIRQGQDYDAALANGDAGLSDALFKIDQRAPASWQACSPSPCTTSDAGRTFKYWSQRMSDTEYVISAVGYAGKSKHGLQARITRTAKFPYALFSQGPLHLDGAASAGPVKVAFGVFAGTGQVRVGSNSTVNCNGVVPPNLVVDWGSAQAACPDTQVNKLAIPRDMSIDAPPQPNSPPNQADVNWENCPNNGVFGATTTTTTVTDTTTGVVTTSTVPTSASNPITIQGNNGPFVCRRNVQLLGYVIPDPAQKPVEIYILPRFDTTTGKPTNYYGLDMSTAIVNPAQPARMFQIYKVGNEPILHNSSGDLTFRGVLFAPDTRLTINGGDLFWAGSITTGQLTVNGTPNLKILYDLDLATFLGPDWRVSRYREISSAQAKPNVVWATP